MIKYRPYVMAYYPMRYGYPVGNQQNAPSGPEMGLSARNQFRGRIVSINIGEVVGQVTMDIGCGNVVSSVITSASIRQLGLRVGAQVIAIVKSTSVMIMKDSDEVNSNKCGTMLSARNQFRGKVVELNQGDVVGRVTVDIECNNLASSVITTASIRQLGIKVGSTVKVVIKSTDVMIMTPEGLA